MVLVVINILYHSTDPSGDLGDNKDMVVVITVPIMMGILTLCVITAITVTVCYIYKRHHPHSVEVNYIIL